MSLKGSVFTKYDVGNFNPILGNENGHSRSDSVLAAQGFWRRKDFGGTGGGAGGGPGVKEGGGAGQGISSGVVCSL